MTSVSDVAQYLLNAAFAVSWGLTVWWLNTVWVAIKDLQTTDKSIAAEVSDLKVLVAGGYVRTEALDNLSHAIFLKLDRIEDKIDRKADK